MVIKSPYPTINVPQVDIPTLLFETPRPERHNFPRDRPIFLDSKSDRSLSLNQLHEQSRRFGAGLVEKWGWGKGDVVCIFSLNQFDTGVVTFGTHYALGVGKNSLPDVFIFVLFFSVIVSKIRFWIP